MILDIEVEGNTMMTIDNISFTYKGKKGTTALQNINLRLDRGFTFLVGENGSGKTTLMKLMTGILDAGGGSIKIDGIPVGNMEYRKKLAYLPQVFDIYPSLKVREALKFIAGLKGVSDEEFDAQIDGIIKQTGLALHMDKKMKQCSEGTRRRIGIASTLIGAPEVIIMDEPTAGIDPKERLAFYKTVRECFAGKTVLIATHVLSDVDYLADSVAMLKGGTLAYSGNYEDFKHSLDGRVYTLTCDGRKLNTLEEKYAVLSTQKNGDTYECHVMPLWEAAAAVLEKTEPTMEDVWLYYERTV